MLQFIRTYGRTKSRNMNISIMENSKWLQQNIPKNTENIHLEIGFGNGENIIHRSLLLPHTLQVGIDVYKNGICKVLKTIESNQITNICLINRDVREILDDNCKISSLYIMFPDPWHKKSEKKQHKKRLINKDFLQRILLQLEPNGIFIFASDHKDYYDNIKLYMEQIGSCHMVEETINSYPVIQNMHNYFTTSNYEKKAINARHYIYYRKNP